MPSGFTKRRRRLRRGDWVDVLSAAEIAATLDADGRLDGLPFMPEMAAHCGRRYRVHRRADKTCVEGLGLRRLRGTVFLEELRCDGGGHDGCQRGCMMFWNEAWLRPAGHYDTIGAGLAKRSAAHAAATSGFPRPLPTRDGDRYICQSTALASATGPLTSWNPAHLVREVINRELSIRLFLVIIVRALLDKARASAGLRPLGALAGTPAPKPRGDLGLTAGDRVRVKPAAELTIMLDDKGRNRGLTFEPDMAACIGREYVVAAPIRKIILEQTGRMVELSNTVALDGVVCQGVCSKNCPRANQLFWRESWLTRVDAAASPTKSRPAPALAEAATE